MFNATTTELIPDYLLPPVQDDDGDNVTISIKDDTAMKYVRYNRFSKTLIFSEFSKTMSDHLKFQIVL